MKLKETPFTKRFRFAGNPHDIWHLVQGKEIRREDGQYKVLCRNNRNITCWIDWEHEVEIVARTPYEAVMDEGIQPKIQEQL